MRRQQGFTVIEVTLFLAVSGFFAVSLLAGAGLAVQRQQYRDAVQSFASYLRDQYSGVINVENDRSSGKCPISGADSGDATGRGQSDCVIIGRYIETVGDVASVDGGKYQSQPVYALSADDGTRSYRLGEGQERNVNWSGKTKLSNGSSNLSILMYRDPDSGSLYVKTFNRRFNNGNLSQAFSGAASSLSDAEICVHDEGWMLGERLSVFLRPYASSANAITIDNAKECENG